MSISKQTIFTKSATHLLKQGERSTARTATAVGPLCRYRGEGGRSCAVGALIADEHYTEEIEGCVMVPLDDSLDMTSQQEQELRGALTKSLGCTEAELEELRPLLGELQGIHDEFDPADWERCLSGLAESEGLTMPAASIWTVVYGTRQPGALGVFESTEFRVLGYDGQHAMQMAMRTGQDLGLEMGTPAYAVQDAFNQIVAMAEGWFIVAMAGGWFIVAMADIEAFGFEF